uniref:Uncharacterized protein n=1 Tax=viral metagenome TaxID=1070528 RepID=A0A6M3KJH4_9ZZZZ
MRIRYCLNCHTRKDKEACFGYDFYTVNEIQYCRRQVLWLIEHQEIKEGKWPTECLETGYTGGPSKRVSYKASFETPLQVIAELDYRLERTGIAGRLLNAKVIAGLNLDHESVSALHYVTGWRRKLLSFKAWRKQFTYRNNQKEIHHTKQKANPYPEK